jgi:hypothetical protein
MPKVDAISEVVVLVHRGRERRWARALAQRLEHSLGRRITLLADTRQQVPGRLPYEKIDRAIHGPPDPDLVGWFATDRLEAVSSAAVGGRLLIDATDCELDQDIRSACSMVLTPRFDHRKGSEGLIAALAGSGTPYLSAVVTTARESRELVGAHIAVPVRDPVTAFLNTVFARLVTLIDAAVRHLLLARPLPLTGPAPAPHSGEPGPRHTPARKAKAFVRGNALVHRLAGQVVRTADWTIGVRRAAVRPLKGIDLNPETFLLVPCDYGHFYADPMIFTHQGATHVFFEDYDYASSLGSLSCVTVEEDGRIGDRIEVMKRASHLSYPFVFAHDGEIYMIPETGSERRVELWRARRFPDQWDLCSVLLSGVEAVDATVKYDPAGNRWWMFVSVAEPGGCTYDTLSIYYSSDLHGGWEAHPLNPVKLDPSCSRPAGPIVEEDGTWLRPAQDCTRGYGSGLAWCRITELTPETFHEEVVDRWLPPSGYRGLHTFTRADGWEAIDLQRRRWRWGES